MDEVIIIAEAGVNHNGHLETAKRLIDAAAEAKVDYVKFQTFKADRIASYAAQKADYQKGNTGNAIETQLQMLQKLELSREQHFDLMDYCNKKAVSFFSTAFDLKSLDFLKELGLSMVKIPSGEITNLPYLRKAASLFSKVILSTGMSSMDEIADAVQVFLDHGISREDIVILHCNTEYPTPFSDVNLRAMRTIAREFGTRVGYSDHTSGIEVAVAATALGASVIEKHFTLDKGMAGPDHKASLEPHELKAMVSAIRNVQQAMAGDGEKKPSPSEQKNINIARKSIVATREIKKGELLTEENLTTKRPGNGISPMKWDDIVGKPAVRDFNVDDLIEL